MKWEPITAEIEKVTGQSFKLLEAQRLTGGDINTAFCLKGRERSYFAKLNRPDLVAMFSAEAKGLVELAATNTVKVPKPILCGIADNHAYLVLEFIEFGMPTKVSGRLFGQQLAQMHQQRQPFFGWHLDNTIGITPQINSREENWVQFWRRHRLQYQLAEAAAKGHTGQIQTLGDKLCDKLDSFFESYHPQPSLLHGDLWGGNAAVDKQGNPVIYDPACYYGDKETDLAMTQLFGGFSYDFYAGYREISSIDEGYSVRKKLYNLYHILNHANMFGGGYIKQAETMIASLLSEVG